MGRGRQPALDGREGKESQKSKVEEEEQFHGERPLHSRSRILGDWLNPAAARKGHSLADQVGGWGTGSNLFLPLRPARARRRESCMRENCTCSLSGGRRLAP